ncbi:alpha/beta hydrolase [Microbacterium sp. LRZ72]|uniref:alpha/beta fold hydrolase n=1 Tax=Microbacterium sp. LRZ72 TaxID=2942481 RepID=UPI0029B563E1|nr:alpha/beta hydrolase [Microbacterium sp. LRZ72]MDX2375892.1 alpha/beta hydrolase [Microbacterium sp. LRZ72]
MPAPLTLPRTSWGAPAAPRRALLVHGLGSTGALMWRFGATLADEGWRAIAVDLRGHGTAPRALDYTIAAYAADLAHTVPDAGEPWDLVIGHSLGGAAAVVAGAEHPGWARRLVLVDPGIVVDERDGEVIRASQQAAFAHPSEATIRAEHPGWHPHDVELKAVAAVQASRHAVEQTGIQNSPWDVRAHAIRVTVPAHVIAADPAVYSLFSGPVAEGILAANPLFTLTTVAGAGHSPHRDKPDETMRMLREILT